MWMASAENDPISGFCFEEALTENMCQLPPDALEMGMETAECWQLLALFEGEKLRGIFPI